VPTADQSTGQADPDWAAFAALDRMKNHWDRPGWRPGRRAYYWYLSFRDQHDVQALAEQCQSAIDAPYFDLVAPRDLHMTIERIAYADEIDISDRLQVAEDVKAALHGFNELRFQIGPLAGSSGALSFSASPRTCLLEMRSRVLTAMHRTGLATASSGTDSFRPHVGISYCNRPVEAHPIIERVRALRALPPVDVCISELTLVTLTRHDRAYSWEVADRVPLAARD
jgi:2'-5' RNA ligase